MKHAEYNEYLHVLYTKKVRDELFWQGAKKTLVKSNIIKIKVPTCLSLNLFMFNRLDEESKLKI